MPNALSRFFTGLFQPIIDKTIRERLSIAENENTFFVGVNRYGETERDRPAYDREDILQQCFEAWQTHPLARRIVELTSQYVIGGGFDFKCEDERSKDFLNEFWFHRLNRMPSRSVEMCDELTRSGNLFVLLSTDASGMSYIRIIPTNDIDLITPSENDIEQPISITTKANHELEAMNFIAYDHLNDSPDEKGAFSPVFLHYAINRPAGGQWGEPDLAPLLPWLRRYTAWLEDRIRLNRFRNAFMYQVKGSFNSEKVRKARQMELAANPPSPGSILVTDESETWSVISPKLEATDANTDGLTLKKLILGGVGLPLHFLAEPEGSNRSTAESAGGPTFRRFEQRQRFFSWLLSDLIDVVLSRRSMIDKRITPQAKVELTGPDISARDNVSASIAASNITNVAERLFNMGLISDREMLRMIYRLAGEPADIDEILSGGSGMDNRSKGSKPIQPASSEPVDVQSGSPKDSTL